jgi:bla regulator protein BlaR1
MHIFNTFPALNTALQALGLALFHSLWQGIVIGLLCTLLLRMMHKKMAASRFMVAYAALILLFLSFTATFYAQFYALSSTAQEVSFNTAISDKEIPVIAYTASSQESRWEAVTIFYQTCIQELIAYAPFIVAFWLLGFFWYSAQLTFGFYQVQQMRSKSFVPEGKWLSLLQHLQHKMKMQKVQLLISPQATAPFTLGWLRPVILLPPGIFTELSANQLEAILVHELAHIKRHDYLFNIMQSVIEVFLFFNPTYWYLASVLEKEREQACDQITINILHQPVVYARALTRLAETSHKTSSDIAVAAIGKQYLKQRIQNIMQNASYTPHPADEQLLLNGTSLS